MKPAREHATNNAQTYFVTSDTWERRALFRAESWARLFFKTLLSNRGKAYLLHEFILMPDHFHLLIVPFQSPHHGDSNEMEGQSIILTRGNARSSVAAPESGERR